MYCLLIRESESVNIIHLCRGGFLQVDHHCVKPDHGVRAGLSHSPTGQWFADPDIWTRYVLVFNRAVKVSALMWPRLMR